MELKEAAESTEPARGRNPGPDAGFLIRPTKSTGRDWVLWATAMGLDPETCKPVKMGKVA
jgi:hypothetical protein